MKISIKFYLRIAQISLFAFIKYNIVGCNRKYYSTSFFVFYFYFVVFFYINFISFSSFPCILFGKNAEIFLENLVLINDKNDKGHG